MSLKKDDNKKKLAKLSTHLINKETCKNNSVLLASNNNGENFVRWKTMQKKNNNPYVVHFSWDNFEYHIYKGISIINISLFIFLNEVKQG